MKPNLKYIAGYLTITVALCFSLYFTLTFSAMTTNLFLWPAYLRLVGIFGVGFIATATYNQLFPNNGG